MVTISGTQSIANITVASADNHEYTFLGTGTLNVSGNFNMNGNWNASFQPTLNLTGAFLTLTTWTDTRSSVTFGLQGGSYTAGDTFAGGITAYNSWNLFIGGNNTTFGGTLMVQSTMPSGTMYGYRNGRVGDLIQIGGTGNTYLAGTTLDLGFGGEIQFTGTQNFTNLTAITFAGGMLDLTAANSFPNMGGFDVTQGVLAVSSNLTMGADNTNGITLGSAHDIGYMMGHAANAAGSYITRAITLSGVGGEFDLSSDFDSNSMTLATSISGSGTLIKSGDETLNLVNGSAGGASSYSGGTYVLSGQLYVDTNRTLGTGNAYVPFGGANFSDGTGLNPTAVNLTAASNLAPGATVYLGHSMNFYGGLILSGDFAPPVDPTSTGTIFINTSSGTFNTTLTSIGDCFLAGYYGVNGSGMQTYNGATLPVGADGTYRLGGSGFTYGAPYFQMLNIGTGQANMLTGNNSLLVYNGGAKLWGPNNYTGTTTISDNLSSQGWSAAGLEAHFGAADSTGNYSALGSTSGAVVMQDGLLFLSNDSAQQHNDVSVTKGAMSFQGQDMLELNDLNKTELDFTVSSLTRVNYGILDICSMNTVIGVPDATTNKRTASSSPAAWARPTAWLPPTTSAPRAPPTPGS